MTTPASPGAADPLVLTPFPPSLHPPGRAHPFSAVEARSERQTTVLVTLGTIFNAGSGDLFERILGGLGDLDVDVVATVGRGIDPASLGPRPLHVRVERFVPQAEVLPTVDLVVSHGGSGSLVATLTHGLPSLLVPLGADQPHNASRATALGVAERLDGATLTPSDVADRAAALLADGPVRARCREVAAEVAALPDIDTAVAALKAAAR